MSELQELRRLQIANEQSDQFFVEMEELLARHLDNDTPIQTLVFYMELAKTDLLNAVAGVIYDEED